MRRSFFALAALATTSVAQATIVLTANITTSQENPPTNPTLQNGNPRPLPSGTATFFLEDQANPIFMTMTATITNLDFTGSQTTDPNDNVMNAHIHNGANSPPQNNAVVWGFIGSPFNDTNPTDTVVTPFASPGVGATITSKWDNAEGQAGVTLTNQLANIFAGHAYINFHTVQFGGGEIRGAILPEPATAALFSISCAAIARRRR